MSLYTILNHNLELVPSFTQPNLSTASDLSATTNSNTTSNINKSKFQRMISDGSSELIKEQLFSSTPTVELPETEGTILDFFSI
ncbi:hypothetical protein FMO003_04050 [Moritella sp. F3]|nr:hypothetical protein FMO001_16680 [Moritella sp. F1]GIC80124.1 hypothetical protein FMO003_04050 [Moritella sp. F3]